MALRNSSFFCNICYAVLHYVATVVPSAAPACTGNVSAAGGVNYAPSGCAHIAELGPQAYWLAVSALELGVALFGAVVGLAVVIALSVFFRRA